MISADIKTYLDKINNELKVLGESRELVVCGGAAMILSNYTRHSTQDIDMLRPVKDPVLTQISIKIASEIEGLRDNWLNSDSSVFIKESLPKDWEDRLTERYKSSHLSVLSLSIDDLLFSKVCAHIDPEMDEPDIFEIVGSNKLLFQSVADQVLNTTYKNNSSAKLIIDELKIKLGIS